MSSTYSEFIKKERFVIVNENVLYCIILCYGFWGILADAVGDDVGMCGDFWGYGERRCDLGWVCVLAGGLVWMGLRVLDLFLLMCELSSFVFPGGGFEVCSSWHSVELRW